MIHEAMEAASQPTQGPQDIDDLLDRLQWRCKQQWLYLRRCVREVGDDFLRGELQERLDMVETALIEPPFDLPGARKIAHDLVEDVIEMLDEDDMPYIQGLQLLYASVQLEDLTAALLCIGAELEVFPGRTLH